MRKAVLDEKGRVVNLERIEEQKSKAHQDIVKRTQDYVAKKYGFDKGTE